MRKILQFIVLCGLVLPCCGASEPSKLSLEDKISQLLMVHFHGNEANEEARVLIQELKVGGIIYYNWANGLDSPQHVQALSASLQQFANANSKGIPLLIATDQEGGRVNRLNQGFTIFPGNEALGKIGDAILAEEVAYVMGQELSAVGVNMSLAPVVDVNSNPRNPVIGKRSFGADPSLVATLGDSFLKGYKRAQIIGTLKHYPGHGDTSTDSHQGLPIVYKTQEELERVELLPFARLAGQADVVMTAHILLPALDKENCSTLSEKTLGYLRETLGFQGVIISDSLIMDGVLNTCKTVDEAAIQALNAGCDLLLLGGKLLIGEHAGFEVTLSDVKRIHRSIVEAVIKGRISEERVDQAVDRVLSLKERYLSCKTVPVPLDQVVNTAEHRVLAESVAERASKIAAP